MALTVAGSKRQPKHPAGAKKGQCIEIGIRIREGTRFDTGGSRMDVLLGAIKDGEQPCRNEGLVEGLKNGATRFDRQRVNNGIVFAGQLFCTQTDGEGC